MAAQRVRHSCLDKSFIEIQYFKIQSDYICKGIVEVFQKCIWADFRLFDFRIAGRATLQFCVNI